MFDHIPLTLAQTDERPDAGTPQQPPTTQTGEGPATTGEPGAPPAERQVQPSPFGGSGFMFMLLLLLVFMFGMTWWSQRKEKKRRAEMLTAMKKNDRVVTIGGIIGTVVEVKENEVTLKVDESSNTRMRFSRSAIQSVLGEAEA